MKDTGEVDVKVAKLYQWIEKIDKSGQPLNLKTLKKICELKNSSELVEYVHEIESVDILLADYEDYIVTLTNDNFREFVANDIRERGTLNVELLKTQLSKEFSMKGSGDGTSLKNDYRKSIERLMHRYDNLIPSGFQKLDEDFLYGGVPEASLNLIIAGTHAGKTQTLINMAHRLC